MNRLQSPKYLTASTLFALAAALSGTAAAQSYPVKAVRIIASNIGSPQDIVPRILQAHLAEYLGQAVLIEGRTGAGGVIAAAEVAKSPADGYTILSAADNLPTAHHLIRSIPYDGLKAFAPITRLVSAPPVLAASAAFAPKTLAEFIAYAKANPGKVTLANSGSGTRGHIASAMLAGEAGIELNLVPFKGAAPVGVALLSVEVNTAFVQPIGIVQNVRTGKVKALAVAGKSRVAQFPDTPTVSELIPGFEAVSWFGVLAPAGTLRDVVARLNREFSRAAAQPDSREKIAGIGLNVDTTTPEEFAAFLDMESEKFGRVIRQYKITAD